MLHGSWHIESDFHVNNYEQLNEYVLSFLIKWKLKRKTKLDEVLQLFLI